MLTLKSWDFYHRNRSVCTLNSLPLLFHHYKTRCWLTERWQTSRAMSQCCGAVRRESKGPLALELLLFGSSSVTTIAQHDEITKLANKTAGWLIPPPCYCKALPRSLFSYTQKLSRCNGATCNCAHKKPPTLFILLHWFQWKGPFYYYSICKDLHSAF